jgi:hypothetical protein
MSWLLAFVYPARSGDHLLVAGRPLLTEVHDRNILIWRLQQRQPQVLVELPILLAVSISGYGRACMDECN